MDTRAMRAPHAIPSRLSAAKFSFLLESSSRRLVHLLLGGVTVVVLATTAAAFISPVGTFNPRFSASIAVEKSVDPPVGTVVDAPAQPVADARPVADSRIAVAAPAPADVRNFDDARPIVGANLAGTIRVNNLA